MPDEQLHIIITGDAGEGRAVVINRKFLRNLVVAGMVTAGLRWSF